MEARVEEVGGYVEKKPHGPGGDGGVVHYKGTAVLIKKLAMFDMLDRVADAQDDASELLRGKHVSFQLVSSEVDPSTSHALSRASRICELISCASIE